MRRNKSYYPKRKAILSLQFYRDKNISLDFIITKQEGNLSNETLNMYHFGEKCAEINLLDYKEKESLRSFCVGYMARLMGINGIEQITILSNETDEEIIKRELSTGGRK